MSAVALGVVVVVLFLVVAVAASLQGKPHIEDVSFDWVVVPTPAAEQSVAPDDEPVQPAQPESGPPAVLVSIGSIVVAVVGLLLAILAARLFAVIWNARRLRHRTGATVVAEGASPEDDRTPSASEVRSGLRQAAEALHVPTAAGEGIVAAWISLEAAAAAGGQTRAATETPAEFAVRVVARDAEVAADVRTLLGLYESVRFAGHLADEQDRRAAAAALARIEEAWQ